MNFPLLPVSLGITALLCVAPIIYTISSILNTPPQNFVNKSQNLKPKKCEKYPAFNIGYEKEENGITKIEKGFRFSGNGWIEIQTCMPGKIVIIASGESALGQPPILNILLNSENLRSEEFLGKKTLTIDVPTAGNIRLGYFNDFYKADVRIAFLRSVSLINSKCGGQYSIDIPENNGGDWKPDIQTITIVKSSTIHLTPCSRGELHFRLEGVKGNNEFPIIKIIQAFTLKKRIQTSDQIKDISLKISGEPIEIILTNPYAKTLEDRNLYIESVVFLPKN